jgi:hypothetical protein
MISSDFDRKWSSPSFIGNLFISVISKFLEEFCEHNLDLVIVMIDPSIEVEKDREL